MIGCMNVNRRERTVFPVLSMRSLPGPLDVEEKAREAEFDGGNEEEGWLEGGRSAWVVGDGDTGGVCGDGFQPGCDGGGD
jgi:hypothetical protein